MKKLYFFSLLLFFTTEYAMKRQYEKQLDFYNKKELPKRNKSIHYVNVVLKKTSSNTAPEIVQNIPLDDNPLANNGLLGLFHKDVITMICIALIKTKPTKPNVTNIKDHFGKKTTCRPLSPILSFFGMCTLNKWFHKTLSEQKKYIYEATSITPIILAALIGDELNFVLEKVLNKEQLYGQFLEGKYPDHHLARMYPVEENIKILLLVCGSTRRNKYSSNYNEIRILRALSPDKKSYLNIFKSKRAEKLINSLVQKKKNTLTEAQHTLLTNTYTALENHDLLIRLYNDFIYTVQVENVLHSLFDRSKKIPFAFFTELKNRGGNLLAYDTDKKTFLDKASTNSKYNYLLNELISLSETQPFVDQNHTFLTSYELLFPNGIDNTCTGFK
ncbi:MAG TPA: hypothetical protein VL201_02740 [Patescibacteria group bacterium]|jgi:hypothetical protein|nr:hypothetical protein [Patescibacteria group bacterium]